LLLVLAVPVVDAVLDEHRAAVRLDPLPLRVEPDVARTDAVISRCRSRHGGSAFRRHSCVTVCEAVAACAATTRASIADSGTAPPPRAAKRASGMVFNGARLSALAPSFARNSRRISPPTG